MEKIHDHILLKSAVCRGDKKAIEVLYNKYYQQMKSYISSRVHSDLHAEDLAQNLFVELLRGTGQYDDYGNAEAYLRGIAKNIVNQYHQRSKNQLKIIHLSSLNNIAESLSIPKRIYSVSEKSPWQLRDVIKVVVDELPPKAREAVKLRFIDGLSTKEAAKIAGCSVRAFYSRIYEGIKFLKKLEEQIKSEKYESNKAEDP